MEKVPFSEPLFFLNVVGLHPLKNNKIAQAKRIFLFIISATVITSSYLELILNSRGFETYSRASEALIPQYQFVCKVTVLIVYRRELSQLLEDSKKFWLLGKFGVEFGNKFVTSHIHLKRFFLLYKTLMICTGLQYIALKIIFKSDKPMALCYGESKGLESPYTEFYFCLHSCFTLLGINVITGFDGLFFYFVGHVLTEFEMVKTAFGTCNIITFSCKNNKRLRKATKHHSLVLDFVRRLNEMYSILLLNQHLTCLFGICFGLFLISKDGLPPTFHVFCKCTPVIIAFTVQTATFCFAGNFIITWSLQIPNEIFHQNWLEDDVYREKMTRILAIRRGQRAAKLTLGGFADLDLESFTVVLKNSFSFFTFFNSMNDNVNNTNKQI